MKESIDLPGLREHLGNFLGTVSGVCMTFVKLLESQPIKDDVAVQVIVSIEDRYLAHGADVVALLASRYFEHFGLRYKLDLRPVGVEDFRRLHQLDDAWHAIHPGRK